MKKIAFLSIFAATTALAACSDDGSYGDREHRHGDRGGMHDCWKNAGAQYWFAQIDTNHDGRVTRTEFASFNKKMFSEADANHDGVLSVNELKDEHQKNWQEMRGAIQQSCVARDDSRDYNNNARPAEDMRANQ